MDAHAIASARIPVLCIDTCSILDIMRDPTRETARPHDMQAAVDLVAAAENGCLSCLMAEQVAVEFALHDQAVQDEAKGKIAKMRSHVERINQLSAVYGAPGYVNLNHLDEYVTRARDVVGRLVGRLNPVTPSAAVPGKAFARMNAGLPPARRGKDSSKDCLIYETYLEAMSLLRRAGTTGPIVLLSSNTSEYLTESNILKSEIAAELGGLGVDYAPNMSAAKRALGL